MPEIKLSELTMGEVRNLSGHDRGLAARDHFKMDILDDADEEVVVIAPNNLSALSTSFFQGMFSRSINKLGGREKFLVHYKFRVSPAISRQVERGIIAASMNRDKINFG